MKREYVSLSADKPASFHVFKWCMVLGLMLSMIGYIQYTPSPTILTTEPDDLVTHLPGYPFSIEKQYAGLVPVNAAGGDVFYWFFEARPEALKSNVSTPVIMWLNGGPGASSMTGAMTEMGPYRIQPNGSLVKHPQSWTNLGHMLFFDQPVGTGYSGSKCSSDQCYVSSEDEMAEQLHKALMIFYNRHPEYQKNPLYIAGESFAGKYVPYIAHYIHQQRQIGNGTFLINLKGIAIGNGILWPVIQTRSVPDFALALGLIDQHQYDHTVAQIDVCAQLHAQNKHKEAFQLCQDTEDEIYQKYAGNPFVYDIRRQGNPFDELTQTLTAYFNSLEVRMALNVGATTPWKSIDGSSYGVSPNAPPIAKHLVSDEILDVPNQLLKDLIESYQFLFYAGNMDGSSCNNLGISRVIDRLQWNESDKYSHAERAPWKVNDQVAGLVKHVGQFYYIVLLNSGHLVPTDVPDAALDMMDRFLNQKPYF